MIFQQRTKTLGHKKHKKISINTPVKILGGLVATAVVALLVLAILYATAPCDMQHFFRRKIAETTWTSQNGDEAVYVSSWAVKRAYPGTLDESTKETLTLVGTDGQEISTVVVYPNDGIFIHDGQAYRYSTQPNTSISYKFRRSIDDMIYR